MQNILTTEGSEDCQPIRKAGLSALAVDLLLLGTRAEGINAKKVRSKSQVLDGGDRDQGCEGGQVYRGRI